MVGRDNHYGLSLWLEKLKARADNKIEDVKRAWIDYKARGSVKLRNRLALHYLPKVIYNAKRISKKIGGRVELEDLVSAGVFGMLDAMETFDLNRGLTFDAHCKERIKGAIFDDLRSMDWRPRLVKSRAKKVENARKELADFLGYAPPEAELRLRLVRKYGETRAGEIIQDGLKVIGLSNYDDLQDGNDSKPDLYRNSIADPLPNLPEARGTIAELKEYLGRGLNRTEKLVIALYHQEKMTMEEIGEVINITKSRVVQINRDVVKRVKERLVSFEFSMARYAG